MHNTCLPGAVACIAALSLQAAVAQPKPPENAKPLAGEQITQELAYRTFKFVVHDAGVQASGTSTWDPAKAIAYGDYVWGSSQGQWKREWKVMDDQSCSRDPGAKWECYRVYLDGQIHYEVREDGLVHATSTPLVK